MSGVTPSSREIAAELHFDTPTDWIDVLRAWASNDPRLNRVWIFGSRVTGVRREKDGAGEVPDVDVAYEILETPGADETAYTYHFFRVDRWRERLQAQIPVPLDLQYTATDDPDACMPRFVAAAGRLIYDAGGGGRDHPGSPSRSA